MSKVRASKRLSLEEFERASGALRMGERAFEMTRAVLVDGARQLDQAEAFGITRGAVSQAVNKVWQAAQKERCELPEGFEKLTVVLPEHRAFLVKKWADEAKELLNKVEL